MNSRLIIVAGDISSSPILLKRFRGKVAKEVYRCNKGVLLTGSFIKPVAFAIATIPAEMSKGIIYTAIGQVGETIVGYATGLGFVRYIYKVAQPAKIKATANS